MRGDYRYRVIDDKGIIRGQYQNFGCAENLRVKLHLKGIKSKVYVWNYQTSKFDCLTKD